MNPLDALNLNLTGSGLPNPVAKSDNASRTQKEQFAKDFESVFLERLLDEMKNTIGDWGFEQDGASKQIQGLFWMNLARDVSGNGGIGLWKEIYQSINTDEAAAPGPDTIDNKL
jgi:Rod binding domain-containing protein